MNVQIFNVLDKNGKSFRNETGREFLVNISRVRNVVSQSITETALLFTPDWRLPTTPQKWVVANDLASVLQSISGSYNDNATILLTPNKINGKTNTIQYSLNVNDISFAVMDGSNAILHIVKQGRMDLDKWQFDSTSLITLSKTINQATSNQDLTVTFGACTTSTQAVTYATNLAGTLELQVLNGGVYVTIDADAVTAGSGGVTFSFPPGDLVSGSSMRVGLRVGAQFFQIAESTFSCTGGSGSGSGATGDCNMYAYFDGDGWNDTLNTLNWGASCTQGYVIQVSSSNDDFVDEDAYVVNTETEDTTMHLTLTAGTYYARVRNIAGQTRFSPTLTFVAS